MSHIIVLGNEKGGVGKTTTAIHVILSLMYAGKKVTSIDIDSRQRSISHYLQNRRNHIVSEKINLPFPEHFIVNASKLDSKRQIEKDESQRFLQCLEKSSKNSDFIIVDSPGNDTFMSQLAHSYANTIITPINDSFVDLNLLAHMDDKTLNVKSFGVYSQMVWNAKLKHAKREKTNVDWVVVRNRLSSINAKNKQRVAISLDNISKKVGFRVSDGLSERVIYRELYLKGLSLLDIIDNNKTVKTQVSHIAARQELRNLMNFLNIIKEN